MMELSAPVACLYVVCTGQSFFSAACVQHRNCCYTSMLNHAGRLSLFCPTGVHDLKFKSFTG